MSFPTPYTRQANFISSASGPDGAITVQQIATNLDAEFNAVKVASDSTQTNLALIQRDDGTLQSSSVGVYQLASDTVALIASKASTAFKGSWAASTVYQVGDSVAYLGAVYFCITAHTSTASFDTAKFVATFVVLDNTVSTSKIQNNAVTVAKLKESLDLSGNSITLPPNVVLTGNINANAVIPAKLSTGGPTWDVSGNLTATSFVGPLTGNAATATTAAACSGNAATATKFASAPAFSAYQSTAQTVPSATYTKVQLQTEEYDTNNCFDSTTNYRFTPNVAGYYQLNAAFFLAVSSVTCVSAIYKNGTIYKKGQSIATAGGISVSSLVYLNGSTDYVEFYCYATVGQALLATVENTYFNGVLVKPA